MIAKGRASIQRKQTETSRRHLEGMLAHHCPQSLASLRETYMMCLQ